MGTFLFIVFVVLGTIALVLWARYLRLGWPYHRWRVLYGTGPFKRFVEDLQRSYARLDRLEKAGRLGEAGGREDLRRLVVAHDLALRWWEALQPYAGDLEEYGFGWFVRQSMLREHIERPHFPDAPDFASLASAARGWAERLQPTTSRAEWAVAERKLAEAAPEHVSSLVKILDIVGPEPRPSRDAPAEAPSRSRSDTPAGEEDAPRAASPTSAPREADDPVRAARERWRREADAALDLFEQAARSAQERVTGGALHLNVDKHVAALRGAVGAYARARDPDDARQALRTMGTRGRMLAQLVEAHAADDVLAAAWLRVSTLLAGA